MVPSNPKIREHSTLDKGISIKIWLKLGQNSNPENAWSIWDFESKPQAAFFVA
jgi:hypothetical protein